jgi:intein/homing endonuclease
MSNQKYTIYQRLTKMFGYNGQPIPTNNSYNFSKNDLLKTDSKDEYDKTLLQSQQSQYITDKWAKLDQSLYNQSVYYEANRLAAYYDFESMEFSIHGDTNIATPNGFITIKELADKGRDYEFTVYAYDHNQKKVVPAIARNAHFTRNEMTYKITFDDGTFIIATYGHRFLKRNGEFCVVEELKEGDSMMPFYRKSFFNNNNYNWIYSCNSKEGHHGWVSEHNLVAEWFYDKKIGEDEEVHHIDFNGKNNLPENLKIMNINEHRSYHAKIHNKKMWENPLYVQKMKEVAKRTGKHSWDGKRVGINNPSYINMNFNDIVEIAKEERTLVKTASKLNVSLKKIKNELRFNGFKSWDDFLNVYKIKKLVPQIEDRESINFEHIPWDLIIKTAKECGTTQSCANKLNITISKLTSSLKMNGFKNWGVFMEAYGMKKSKAGRKKETNVINHKIVSIEPFGVVPVYDLTVPGYKNFATDTIFSHNTPEISAALDIFSEESSQISEKGEMLTIFSESDRIKTVLEDLFKNKLDINTNLPMWTRGMCKYGDDFVYLKIDPNDGIIGCQQLPNIEIERIEGGSYLTNKSDNMNQSRELRFAWKNRDMEFQNWEIAHFRLLGDDRKLPYGTCLKYNTRIETENGVKEIKDIVVGDMVWSFDTKIQTKVLSKVLDTVNSGVKETFKLSTKYNSIEVSKEHRIMFYNKETKSFDYKNTLDFKIGDLLVLDSIKNNIEKFLTEPIISIEKSGNFETYDIYVENENHNFYANGVVVHNSILDKIRRIWKQLLLAEDAMLIYRTTRAPERRVFKVFVGNMDDKDIESYVQRVANKFKRDQVVDQKTGQVDMRYNQMPVWSKTPIPLLDGRTITIEELAKEYEEGKQNWVYSIQDKTFAVVPGKVIWCGKNYTANKLTKVWLDDETWVLTAPEHPFILRDGKKVNAEDLKEGDSLMPYYVKKSNQKDGLKIKDYDMIYNPKNGKYQFVHRLVSNSALSKEREQCRKETNFKINNNLTVHHIDFNKNNNSVENLLWIGNVDHIKLHSEYGKINITKYNKSEKKRERNKYLAKRDSWHLRMTSYNHSELHKEHNSIRREAQIKDWSNPEKKLERSVGMRVVLDDNVFEKINEKIISREIINRKTMMEFLSTDIIDYIISINNNKRLNKIKLVNRCVLERHILNKGFKTITDYIDEIKKNHKVSRIETIYENEDVYCMTVVGINGEEDRHNFALKSFKNDKIVSESGVFVSNSVDQDFFIPVRDIAQQNPIETLPGAANLGEIQDIEYLQKKMLAALRVPKAFLGFEDVVGEGKSLALMDIRFARTINKVQKSLIHELNKIALLHLLILGFEDELNNFTLSLTNPSSQSDLLKIEQWKEKITLYKDATSDQSQLGILPVSHTWAKKNILGMSESEVLLDLQQQRLERALGFELSNTQQVIKRTRVFDQVDAKYGISEEDRKKLDATADTEGGDSMGLGSTAPSAPTDGGEALSEDINLFSVIKDKEDLIFDNNKSTDIINELNDKIKDIIK